MLVSGTPEPQNPCRGSSHPQAGRGGDRGMLVSPVPQNPCRGCSHPPAARGGDSGVTAVTDEQQQQQLRGAEPSPAAIFSRSRSAFFSLTVLPSLPERRRCLSCLAAHGV